jgi:hypothetical protein
MTDSTSSQSARILSLLEQGRELTPLDALKEVGCFRLGARIWDLRAAGHPIETRMLTLENGKRVAAYFMPPGEPRQMQMFGGVGA